MGFLDRMVSDMIRRETGFNPRRIVRRVGGRNILLMGAAAVAGGLLTQAARSQIVGAGQSSTGQSSTGVTREPPRASGGSGATALPPLPVLPPLPMAPGPASTMPTPHAEPQAAPEGAVARDYEEPSVSTEAQGSEPAEAAEPPRELLFAILRTMVAASLADGVLNANERQLIETRLQEADLSEPQAARVLQDLNFPATSGELAMLLPAGEDPETLLQFGVLIARADGALSETERRWLHGLADALRVPRERVDHLERDIFPSA
jgi:tellurite resistance protein